MRDKKGPVNKRVDFLSNKLNKYSIRKFTVGTASILIGSLMYLELNKKQKQLKTILRIQLH